MNRIEWMQRLRALVPCALLCTVACAPRLFGGPRALDEAELARSVTIARDEWGVPHIHGPDDASVAFGAAFAQGEDAYWQIEEDYIHALGRAAYWYGERYLGADALIAALDVEQRAREDYAREPADRRQVWDAFAMGLNYYLRVSGLQPRLITRWEPWMLFARYQADAVADALATARLDTAGAFAAIVIEAGRRDASRTWAAAPARTAGGQTLMVQAIDAPFVGRGQLYELHLHSESGWHARGFALLGTPVPRAGHNEHIAWSASGPGAAALDTTVIVFDAADPLLYRGDTGGLRAVALTDTVQVNTQAGVVSRVLRLRRTVDGAIVAAGEHTHTLRAAARGALPQLFAMSRATSITALGDVMDSPAFGRVFHADAQGNIVQWRGADMTQYPADALYDSEQDTARVDGEPVTLESLAARAFDTRIRNVADDIAALVMEWEQVGGTNPERAMRVDEAIEVLRSWDGEAAPESAAATLYVLWQERLQRFGYEGAFTRMRALEDLVGRLRSDWGTVSVPWGEMHRLQRLPAEAGFSFSDSLPSLPLRGVPAWTGAAMVVETVPASTGRRRYAVSGMIVQAVELGARPRTMSITAFGQSADPASPVYFDQASLYARGALKPAWFTREEIAANARRTYRPAESVTVPERR